MDKQKFEGASIEEALKKAVSEIGVDAEKIDYTIVEENKGFLGLGAKVVIEASIKDANCSENIEDLSSVSITKEEGDPIEEPVLLKSESEKDEFFDTAKEFIEKTISLMGINANLVIETVNEENVEFNVVGEDIAILIGKYGATLDSLQYLACIIANKKFPCRRRIVIDADGHRAKRTKELKQRAVKIAEMVVKHGREAVMEPQNAKDRRIVHMALRNFEGVKTYSEGEGMDRHVIISPKDN